MLNDLYVLETSKTMGPYKVELVILFNLKHISEREVKDLIKSGMVENSDDVVVMTKKQYENLCKN